MSLDVRPSGVVAPTPNTCGGSSSSPTSLTRATRASERAGLLTWTECMGADARTFISAPLACNLYPSTQEPCRWPRDPPTTPIGAATATRSPWSCTFLARAMSPTPAPRTSAGFCRRSARRAWWWRCVAAALPINTEIRSVFVSRFSRRLMLCRCSRADREANLP